MLTRFLPSQVLCPCSATNAWQASLAGALMCTVFAALGLIAILPAGFISFYPATVVHWGLWLAWASEALAEVNVFSCYSLSSSRKSGIKRGLAKSDKAEGPRMVIQVTPNSLTGEWASPKSQPTGGASKDAAPLMWFRLMAKKAQTIQCKQPFLDPAIL